MPAAVGSRTHKVHTKTRAAMAMMVTMTRYSVRCGSSDNRELAAASVAGRTALTCIAIGLSRTCPVAAHHSSLPITYI